MLEIDLLDIEALLEANDDGQVKKDSAAAGKFFSKIVHLTTDFDLFSAGTGGKISNTLS